MNIPTTIDELIDERIEFCEIIKINNRDMNMELLSKLKYLKSLNRNFHNKQYKELANEIINELIKRNDKKYTLGLTKLLIP